MTVPDLRTLEHYMFLSFELQGLLTRTPLKMTESSTCEFEMNFRRPCGCLMPSRCLKLEPSEPWDSRLQILAVLE